jgi:DNA-binding transcriptional ArsR family regulator
MTTTVATQYTQAAQISEDLRASHERGESVSSMSERTGLRREVITAELAKHGIGSPSKKRDAVLEYVRAHPGLSIDDIGLRLDLSKSSVSRYLRGAKENQLVVSRKNAPVIQYSDAQMAEALKTAFGELTDRSKGLSRKRYKEIMDGRDAPAAATYIRRYGTWAEACRLAGITASKARRTNYVRDWSNDDIVDSVAEFINTTGVTSYHAYADWARENGKPSGPLLVQRLHGWADARKLAIAKLEISAAA